MNDSKDLQLGVWPIRKPIRLEIKGLNHVPSFKNTKSIYRNKQTGKPFIATKKERKIWMQNAIRVIESQLLCAFATHGIETSTAPHLRSWIASSLPLDDSIQWVSELNVKGCNVEPGQEGAQIIIEQL